MTKEKRKMKIKRKVLNDDFEVVYEDFVVEIGTGCTIKYYTDEQPGTIIDFEPNGKWIKVQEDNSIRVDNNGMSDCQSYVFSKNVNGRIHIFYRTRKDKNIYTDNGTYYDYGCYLSIGYRRKYFDYSF